VMPKLWMLLIYWGPSQYEVDVYTQNESNWKILLILFSDAKHFSKYHIKEVVREGLAQGGSSLEHCGMMT
jgi:hypothetical protein